jgi:hypothetical protein
MDLEDLLRVKDNTSENGDYEYYESENKKDYGTKFKPMSCFEN